MQKNVSKLSEQRVNKKNIKVGHMDPSIMPREISVNLPALNVRNLCETEEVAGFVNKKKVKKVTKKTTGEKHTE